MYFPFISPRRRSSTGKRTPIGGHSSGHGHGSHDGSGSISGGEGGAKSGAGSGSSSSSGGKGAGGSWSGFQASTGAKSEPHAGPYYGLGGGPKRSVPKGQLFSGRPAGGGRRSDAYGNATYGSGYPAAIGYRYQGRGVANRGFPFYFWPITFGAVGGAGLAYLYNDEYGLPTNESRPGGPQQMATYLIKSLDGKTNNTLRIVTDRDSLLAVVATLDDNLTYGKTQDDNPWAKLLQNGTIAPFDLAAVKPEQIWSYARASSAALSVDEYNNTAVFSDDQYAPPSALPKSVDLDSVQRVNYSMTETLPLVDGVHRGLHEMLLFFPNLCLVGFLILWTRIL